MSNELVNVKIPDNVYRWWARGNEEMCQRVPKYGHQQRLSFLWALAIYHTKE